MSSTAHAFFLRQHCPSLCFDPPFPNQPLHLNSNRVACIRPAGSSSNLVTSSLSTRPPATLTLSPVAVRQAHLCSANCSCATRASTLLQAACSSLISACLRLPALIIAAQLELGEGLRSLLLLFAHAHCSSFCSRHAVEQTPSGGSWTAHPVPASATLHSPHLATAFNAAFNHELHSPESTWTTRQHGSAMICSAFVSTLSKVSSHATQVDCCSFVATMLWHLLCSWPSRLLAK